jgi:16S rRNA (guanine(527)-N(7))-methyltransferase RsmG
MLENKSLIKFINQQFSKSQSSAIIEKINIYKEMLLDENERINLISKTTVDDIENRHFLDSIQLITLIGNKARSLVDIGTGAGLPGILLAIGGCKSVYLVEKQAKKCDFLNRVNNKLELDMHILNLRIEDIDDNQFDYVVSRAFAKLNKIISITKNITHKKSKYILLKGKTFLDEIKSVNKKKFNISYIDSITSPDSKIIELSYK